MDCEAYSSLKCSGDREKLNQFPTVLLQTEEISSPSKLSYELTKKEEEEKFSVTDQKKMLMQEKDITTDENTSCMVSTLEFQNVLVEGDKVVEDEDKEGSLKHIPEEVDLIKTNVSAICNKNCTKDLPCADVCKETPISNYQSKDEVSIRKEDESFSKDDKDLRENFHSTGMIYSSAPVTSKTPNEMTDIGTIKDKDPTYSEEDLKRGWNMLGCTDLGAFKILNDVSTNMNIRNDCVAFGRDNKVSGEVCKRSLCENLTISERKKKRNEMESLTTTDNLLKNSNLRTKLNHNFHEMALGKNSASSSIIQAEEQVVNDRFFVFRNECKKLSKELYKVSNGSSPEEKQLEHEKCFTEVHEVNKPSNEDESDKTVSGCDVNSESLPTSLATKKAFHLGRPLSNAGEKISLMLNDKNPTNDGKDNIYRLPDISLSRSNNEDKKDRLLQLAINKSFPAIHTEAGNVLDLDLLKHNSSGESKSHCPTEEFVNPSEQEQNVRSSPKDQKFQDLKDSTETMLQVVDHTLVLSGERERLLIEFRARLTDCGWRDKVQRIIINKIKAKGTVNVKIDDLIKEVHDEAKDLVPHAVKRAMLDMIKSYLMQNFLGSIKQRRVKY